MTHCAASAIAARCIGLRSTLRWPLHRTASDTGPFSQPHRFSLLGKIRLTGLPPSNRVKKPSRPLLHTEGNTSTRSPAYYRKKRYKPPHSTCPNATKSKESCAE